MKKLMKIASITAIFTILTFSYSVYASSTGNSIQKQEYSEEFQKWLKLTDEEKEKVIMPRAYDVEVSQTRSTNPLYKARLLRSSINLKYNLKDVIPRNLSIRNQKSTNSCWAFSAISSLETNLALSNYKRGINLSKIYDFSERHAEYATSNVFLNDGINEKGYNRKAGSGGGYPYAASYLTNGSGAILEKDMPFEDNEDIIDVSKIKNKTVASQVYDTVVFPDYNKQTSENRTAIMNQLKQHIQDYGSIYAGIHGADANSSNYSCYNPDTAAKYCGDESHTSDHAISIIGWDDNYSRDNFAKDSKPTSNGAWIVRNSWGERIELGKVADVKTEIFNLYKENCIAQGWNSASEIPDSFLTSHGYIIENGMVYQKYGDNGIIYVSYEDVNISKELFGIVKATDTVDYDNIYQYDVYYPANVLYTSDSKIMLCNIFDRKNSEKEYLTQISLYAPQTYTCRVFVNPNGTNKSKKDMQQVKLKSGDSETFGTGYHTLEFAEPIELKAKQFAVVVQIESNNSKTLFSLESKVNEVSAFNNVTVEKGKCFKANGNDLDNCTWTDLGNINAVYPSIDNGDSTIKAFTTNELYDESLKNIEITTKPNKTSYYEGENFDKTGMVVKAYYNSKTNPSAILDSSSYSITNGTNLKAGQTSVTITYQGKSVNQSITVEKNTVTDLKITTAPSKTTYKEGQSFDKTGMIVKATYKNGDVKEIKDYTIEDGSNLKANQTKVTIEYADKSVEQKITVTPNPLIEIKITKAPEKIEYVVGQNFDKTGMVVKGVFQDGDEEEILDYTIEDGEKLSIDKTEVTIKYQDKTVKQAISVVEKRVKSIAINKKPNKLQYVQGKEELDLTGGSIRVNYNDDSYEIVELSSEDVKVSGFDNNKLGNNTLKVKYNDMETSFAVEIVEERKPENSNFDNAKYNINSIKYYTFTDKKKKEYALIDVTLKNISLSKKNDSTEYYYYLSSNKSENNISNWIKVSGIKKSNNDLTFVINTKDINNFEDISNFDNLYLYIKEVAKVEGNQSVFVSNALQTDSDVNAEIYVDNVKKDAKNTDNTVSPVTIPQAGAKNIIVIGIAVILIVGTIAYVRYRFLRKYIK